MAVTPGARVEANFGLGGTSSWTSASHTWTAGTLFVIDILEVLSGGVAAPSSIAGGTMTFVKAAETSFSYAGASPGARISTWVAVGDGSTSTVTATFGATITDGFLVVMPYTGTKTTNGGLDAIKQSVPGANAASANPSISLAALQDSGSVAVGFLGITPNGTITAGSGFTQTSSFGHASPVANSATHEYQANVITVNWTAASSQWGALAYEIAAPVVVTFTPLVLTYG